MESFFHTLKVNRSFTGKGTSLDASLNAESLSTLKRITIGRENTLLSDIGYRCYLSKQLNPVSRIMGEDQTLGVTYKTAWFMTHRIREAMRDDSGELLGSEGGPVEVDETFIGAKRPKHKPKGMRGSGHKMKVLSLG